MRIDHTNGLTTHQPTCTCGASFHRGQGIRLRRLQCKPCWLGLRRFHRTRGNDTGCHPGEFAVSSGSCPDQFSQLAYMPLDQSSTDIFTDLCRSAARHFRAQQLVWHTLALSIRLHLFALRTERLRRSPALPGALSADCTKACRTFPSIQPAGILWDIYVQCQSWVCRSAGPCTYRPPCFCSVQDVPNLQQFLMSTGKQISFNG